MDAIIEAVVTIALAIVGVAILATLVSPKARTSQVIQASASGFSNALAVAQSPVTGNRVRIDTSYPGSTGGFPMMSYGGEPMLY